MTQAEQCRFAFEQQTHTISVTTLARRAGAQHFKEWKGEGTEHEYIFPDGSVLKTRGRGRSHRFVEN